MPIDSGERTFHVSDSPFCPPPSLPTTTYYGTYQLTAETDNWSIGKRRQEELMFIWVKKLQQSDWTISAVLHCLTCCKIICIRKYSHTQQVAVRVLTTPAPQDQAVRGIISPQFILFSSLLHPYYHHPITLRILSSPSDSHPFRHLCECFPFFHPLEKQSLVLHLTSLVTDLILETWP